MFEEIEIIDLDREFNEQNGKSELTVTQEDDLRRIKRSVQHDVSLASRVLSGGIYGLITNLFKSKNSSSSIRKIQYLFILIVILLIPVALFNRVSTYEIPSTTNISEVHTGTVLNIDMDNNNKLLYSFDNISIKTSDGYINTDLNGWISQDINTSSNEYYIDNQLYSLDKQTKLGAFIVRDDYAYIKYINKARTASKELILSSSKPSDIDVKTLKKSGERFFEKSGILQIRSYTNSFDNSFLMMIETLAGGELNISSLKYYLLNMEGDMYKSYSTSENSEISININGVGTINLNNITKLGNKHQIVYDNTSDVLRVINAESNVEYIYIFAIDNEIMDCYIEDLLETTTENVFIHKDFDNIDSIGYNTFAIKADNKIYCMKLNDMNNKELQNNILRQLGIESKPLKIKRVQTVIPYSRERSR